MELPVTDIDNIQLEFEKLNNKFTNIHNKFIAVAMDYNHYVDNSWGQKEIYELRDNVQYRLFSAKLHIELMIRQHGLIEHRLNEILKIDPRKLFIEYHPKNPYFENAEKEISAIFDSFLYHIVSIFDYIGTLTNFICGPKQMKQDTLMWTKLANGSRDVNSHFGKTEISKLITELDKFFVAKMYDYRSFLIHKKSDFNRHSFIIESGGYEIYKKINARFIASQKFTKSFQELKTLTLSNQLTTKYVAFWTLNTTIDIIIKILFGLKNEMEINPKVSFGMLGLYDEKTKKMLPVSSGFWNKED